MLSQFDFADAFLEKIESNFNLNPIHCRFEKAITKSGGSVAMSTIVSRERT